MIELKQCPKCGRRPLLGYACGEYFIVGQVEGCGVCDTFGEMHASREQEAEAWNRRAAMDEYIKREDLLELYRMDDPVLNENGHVPLPVIRQNIMDIPAADVAPVVHGRWIEKSAPAIKTYFECSHCGAQENKHTAIKGYYCWRCGAKMDGGED